MRRFVRERKAALGSRPVGSVHPPGVQRRAGCEFDFGEAQVIVAGQRVTAQYMVLTLCYATLPFVMAFRISDRRPCSKATWRRSSSWAVCRTLTQAVQRTLSGHNRLKQQAFIALRSHHLFDARCCNPCQGHEKGLVEALVGQTRRDFLVPVPEAGSWPELNAYVRACCEREKAHRRRGESQTIG